MRDMGALGYKSVRSTALITLRDHGITPSYVRELADHGYKGLSADDCREARDHGIRPITYGGCVTRATVPCQWGN